MGLETGLGIGGEGRRQCNVLMHCDGMDTFGFMNGGMKDGGLGVAFA